MATETSASATKSPPSKPTPANSDFEPPAACIRRLLKQTLPKSTNISKDSLSALSRASGIFILYLTACANDVAREGRRTTIVAKDVIGALKELDFEDFIPAMEKFLEGHRKDELSKKEEKERLKEKKKGGKEGGSGDGDDYAERDSTGKFASMKKEERNENCSDENDDSTLEQAYGKDWKRILSYDKSDDGDDQEEDDDEKIMAAGGEEKKHARDHDNDHDEGDDDDGAGGGESASKKRKIEADEDQRGVFCMASPGGGGHMG